MNSTQLREFVSLENRKKELDAQLKAVNQQLVELEELLVPQFVEDGVQNITCDGRVVYLRTDVYASAKDGDREAVVAALKASELGQYVSENFNSNSLTAYVREVKRDVEQSAKSENRAFTEDDVRQALPDPLGSVLKVSFVMKLASRKA